MSEENNAEVSQEQPAVPSLDDVVNQFASDLPNPETTAPVQPQATESPVIPNSFDPLDPESAKQFAEANAQTVGALQSQVQELNSMLTAQQQAKEQAKVTADINRAVDTIAEQAGIDNKDYIEFKLNKLAETNDGFRKIWENRDLKPQALEETLKAAAHQMKGELDFKADPQLTENHRAAQETTTASATTAQSEFNNPIEEALASAKTPAERQQIWRRFSQGG